MNAIRFGFARGVFSNEAGLGSAPIAHAAANTDNPVNRVAGVHLKLFSIPLLFVQSLLW